MTPQERNQLIDEVIEGLIDSREIGHQLSICRAVAVVLESKGIYHLWGHEDFNFIDIPIIGEINKHWWPPHDLESRILFLKSVKTCHR